MSRNVRFATSSERSTTLIDEKVLKLITASTILPSALASTWPSHSR